MPEDQETAVTRRRSRRQETAVAAEPAFTEAVVQLANDTKATRASSPSTRAHQKVRATAETSVPEITSTTGTSTKATKVPEATEGAVMTDMDTPNILTTADTIPDASRRRRTSHSAGSALSKGKKPSSMVSTPPVAAQASPVEAPADRSTSEVSASEPTPAGARLRRGPRVSRPRGIHIAAEVSEAPTRVETLVESVSEGAQGAAVGATKKLARITKTAPKTISAASRPRHAAKAIDPAEAEFVEKPEGELAGQKATASENRLVAESVEHVSGTPTLAPSSPSFATEPYRPAARSSYRFGRARQENAAEAETTGRIADAPTQRLPAAAEPQLVEQVEHGHRPLRRAGWTSQNGQESDGPVHETRSTRERIQPHVPGGADPYRGRQPGQRSSGVGPSRIPANPGGHAAQHGQFPTTQSGQSGRGSAPYSPGGRGGHTSSQPPLSGHDTPYQSAGGQNPNVPGSPYGGYEPYDPYTFDSRDSRASHERTTQVGRPMRGRGYSNQSSGHESRESRESRDSRAPRQSVRPPSPADYYRREQGLTNQRDARGLPSGRGTLNSHGLHDRRGGGTGQRGPVSGGRTPPREPREVGYSNSLYTSVPGAPALAQPPNDHNDRYDHASNNTNGVDGMPGTRSSGPMAALHTIELTGILWQTGSPFGSADLLDGRTLLPLARVNADDIRRMGLRQADMLTARAEERGGRRLVVAIDSVNDHRPEEAFERPMFDKLTASFPDRRIRLEHGPQPVSVRIIDLFAPLGFGSRALVVAPPKTGKTTLMREAAEAVLAVYPDAVVMAVLVGERPEEVTDLRARLEPRGGLVYAASFDEDTQRHAWLVQVAVERAKRVAESGQDAFMVLDSLTRLARAENLSTRGQGRTLSGGIDAQALDTGRRAFGAARNLEEGGSLTILATCLVDTGSRQDDVVYEEFKGTGNMELHLSRELAQRRLFPAVDAVKSSTRREEMLLTPEELRASTALRRRLADLPPTQATQQLLSVMERTPSNAALLQAIEQSGWIGSTGSTR